MLNNISVFVYPQRHHFFAKWIGLILMWLWSLLNSNLSFLGSRIISQPPFLKRCIWFQLVEIILSKYYEIQVLISPVPARPKLKTGIHRSNFIPLSSGCLPIPSALFSPHLKSVHLTAWSSLKSFLHTGLKSWSKYYRNISKCNINDRSCVIKPHFNEVP